MDHLKVAFIAFFLLASAPFTEAAPGVISEQIYFLEENGRHALVFITNQAEYSNYRMWFQNREGFEKEDYIKNFFYIYPKEYTWDTDSKKGYTLLKFPGSSFASLERIELEPVLQVNGDGIFHFSNHQKEVKNPDGHFGVWNSPDNFETISYTWVFPETFEPIEYRANRAGEWMRKGRSITYTGSNVNDLVFSITYQASHQKTYESLKEKLSDEEVEIAQEPSGIKISVAATVLYPSGVAELSDRGKSLLSKVADTLKGRKDLNIIVEGHADDRPVRGSLISKFPTNWELASVRSINVIHYLAEKGIEEGNLESRSYSFYRPVASNDTDEGRAKNRRIEILIEEKSK